MGLEVWVYAGLTKAANVDVDRDGYPRDWSRYWRAAVVNGTEFAYPGRAAGLEQDAIYEYTSYSEFIAGTAKTARCARAASGIRKRHQGLHGGLAAGTCRPSPP